MISVGTRVSLVNEVFKEGQVIEISGDTATVDWDFSNPTTEQISDLQSNRSLG